MHLAPTFLFLFLLLLLLLHSLATTLLAPMHLAPTFLFLFLLLLLLLHFLLLPPSYHCSSFFLLLFLFLLLYMPLFAVPPLFPRTLRFGLGLLRPSHSSSTFRPYFDPTFHPPSPLARHSRCSHSLPLFFSAPMPSSLPPPYCGIAALFFSNVFFTLSSAVR